MKKLEVCCDGFAAVALAEAAGADRVELCSALEVGGLSPTLATVRRCKMELQRIKVMVMLRNRAGGFCYTDDEYATMLADLEFFLQAGADGIVFGFLNADATIDRERTKKVVERIHLAGKEAVFHRAFDNTPDPFQAMEDLIHCKVDRVLTSGQAPTAPEGSVLLAELVARFGSKIEILAGAGVSSSNAELLLEESGVNQLHASCKAFVEDPTTVGKVDYSVRQKPSPYALQTVDPEEIRRLVELLQRV